MLFDTHNHFDDPVFDHDRLLLVQQAMSAGVQQMVMTGITASTFQRMLRVQREINEFLPTFSNIGTATSDIDTATQTPSNLPLKKGGTTRSANKVNRYQKKLANQHFAHVALGLHPFFINEHSDEDLHTLDSLLHQQQIIAIGEVGLDTFTAEMKQPENLAKQLRFFDSQLELAFKHQLPVLLHIRKAHGDSLKILKNHRKTKGYNAHELGGIAHSFSGGEQEAIAFVRLGFKLGITGQVCNPNAKKLHKAIRSAVAEFGLACLVIETDCPDMLPFGVSDSSLSQEEVSRGFRNTPENLTYVLTALSNLLDVDKNTLAEQLWHNSHQAFSIH